MIYWILGSLLYGLIGTLLGCLITYMLDREHFLYHEKRDPDCSTCCQDDPRQVSSSAVVGSVVIASLPLTWFLWVLVIGTAWISWMVSIHTPLDRWIQKKARESAERIKAPSAGTETDAVAWKQKREQYEEAFGRPSDENP